MADRAEYNFDPVISETTFKGKEFNIEINGLPLDLTGASIAMNVGKIKNNILPTFTTENELLKITDPTGGTFQLTEQVITLTEGRYHYDFVITTSDGIITSYIYGVMPIILGVVFNG